MPISTADILILEEPDTEVVADTQADEINPDANKATATSLQIYNNPSQRQRTYLKFSLQQLHALETNIIENATLYVYFNYVESSSTIKTYRVKQSSWNENTLTFNNQPCGKEFDNSTTCNLVNESSPHVGTTGYIKFDVSNMVGQAINESNSSISIVLRHGNEGSGGGDPKTHHTKESSASTRPYLNISYSSTYFFISSYNLTSDGGEGCTFWTSNASLTCTTTDTTPTIKLTTSRAASCRIGTSNLNYSALGTSRNCTGAQSSIHTCTLTPQDEISSENSFIYIGCADLNGIQSQNSTSGPLQISLHSSDLEILGRNAIDSAASNALSSYSVYASQKLYSRNSANNQFVGTFDKVVKNTNKIWAFNVLTGNDTAVGGFNITPTLYILEFRNSTPYAINQTVQQLITQTR